MAYSYHWQYCDMDFLQHCLKQYGLLLEKIPSAILTEETTGTQNVRHRIPLRLHQAV